MIEKLKKLFFHLITLGWFLLVDFITNKYCKNGVKMAKLTAKDILTHKNIVESKEYKDLIAEIRKKAVDEYKTSGLAELDYLGKSVPDENKEKPLSEDEKTEAKKSFLESIGKD